MEQRRIYLWTAPRCCSTAFYRSINNAPKTWGIFEPFANAFTYGEERQVVRNTVPKQGYRFKEMTARLNKPYTEYDVVFVKDMAYGITITPYSVDKLFPTGYTHTFLIRDPRKSISSLYRIVTEPELADYEYFDERQTGFKALYELYVFVTERMGQKTIIIDADDLRRYPESVLSSYCDFVNIPYNRCMADWGLADPSRNDAFRKSIAVNNAAWMRTATESTSIIQEPPSNSLPDLSSLPKLVQDTIEDQMTYYEFLHEKRLKL